MTFPTFLFLNAPIEVGQKVGFARVDLSSLQSDDEGAVGADEDFNDDEQCYDEAGDADSGDTDYDSPAASPSMRKQRMQQQRQQHRLDVEDDGESTYGMPTSEYLVLILRTIE